MRTTDKRPTDGPSSVAQILSRPRAPALVSQPRSRPARARIRAQTFGKRQVHRAGLEASASRSSSTRRAKVRRHPLGLLGVEKLTNTQTKKPSASELAA